MNHPAPVFRTPVVVPTNGVTLPGELALPARAHAVVIFAQTVEEGRHCPCNLRVAETLHREGVGTFLFDLLAPGERAAPDGDPAGADGPFLAGRLLAVTRWLLADPACRGLHLGFFGSHEGAAAALIAAAWLGSTVATVVARSGRPNLAEGAFRRVVSPVLLVVGERETELIACNRAVVDQMTHCRRELAVVPGADSLIEDPDSIARVAGLARDWFARHLGGR